MFEDEDHITIVMPLLKSNLKEYIKARKEPLSEEEAKAIFRMIADAVDHCHSNGIMHCDLKLENILVNYRSKSFKITDLCLTDFGLSSEMSPKLSHKDRCGTMAYMAPEMLRYNE